MPVVTDQSSDDRDEAVKNRVPRRMSRCEVIRLKHHPEYVTHVVVRNACSAMVQVGRSVTSAHCNAILVPYDVVTADVFKPRPVALVHDLHSSCLFST